MIAIANNLNREAGKNIAILSTEFFIPSSSDRAVKYCSTIGIGIEGIEEMMENHWPQDGDDEEVRTMYTWRMSCGAASNTASPLLAILL